SAGRATLCLSACGVVMWPLLGLIFLECTGPSPACLRHAELRGGPCAAPICQILTCCDHGGWNDTPFCRRVATVQYGPGSLVFGFSPAGHLGKSSGDLRVSALGN